MLYVSTRNTVDAYTAYRALHETKAPDGGYYVPFRLSAFSREEMSEIKKQSQGETIATVLNRFFGLHLSGWDVECVIGRCPFQTVSMSHRLIMAEVWHNPKGCWDYLVNNLYARMINKKDAAEKPAGWSLIAIEIALLFGLYSSMDDVVDQGLDFAVTPGNFSIVIAILYAKDMGLPINLTICGFNENSAVWDFINKGELSTGSSTVRTLLPELDIAVPEYLEFLIFRSLGFSGVSCYLDVAKQKGMYYISEEDLLCLNQELFAAVISANRIELLRSSIYRSNHYHIAPHTALAYGGLQDYRARTGASRNTVILAQYRPD